MNPYQAKKIDNHEGNERERNRFAKLWQVHDAS
jgi:hypothetical protein